MADDLELYGELFGDSDATQQQQQSSSDATSAVAAVVASETSDDTDFTKLLDEESPHNAQQATNGEVSVNIGEDNDDNNENYDSDEESEEEEDDIKIFVGGRPQQQPQQIVTGTPGATLSATAPGDAIDGGVPGLSVKADGADSDAAAQMQPTHISMGDHDRRGRERYNPQPLPIQMHWGKADKAGMEEAQKELQDSSNFVPMFEEHQNGPKMNAQVYNESDLDSFDDKPWRKPGVDLADFFNYGFSEDTWHLYAQKQQELRADSSSGHRGRRGDRGRPMGDGVDDGAFSRRRSHRDRHDRYQHFHEDRDMMPPPQNEEYFHHHHRDRERESSIISLSGGERSRSRSRHSERSPRRSSDRDRERDRDRDRDRRTSRERESSRSSRSREESHRRSSRDRDRSSSRDRTSGRKREREQYESDRRERRSSRSSSSRR